MVSLYQAKPTFQKGLRPLVQQLATWGVTPNQITVSAVALSGFSGLSLACFHQSSLPLLALPGVLLVRMALNAIDGMLAREHNLKTPLGHILNELGDVVSDAVLYLPFALVPGIAAGWIVALVVLAMVTEMTGVIGAAVAQHRPYDGPMGKSDRAFVFGAVAFALGLGIPTTPWLTGLWVGVIALQVWTIHNRIQATLREVAPWQ